MWSPRLRSRVGLRFKAWIILSEIIVLEAGCKKVELFVWVLLTRAKGKPQFEKNIFVNKKKEFKSAKHFFWKSLITFSNPNLWSHTRFHQILAKIIMKKPCTAKTKLWPDPGQILARPGSQFCLKNTGFWSSKNHSMLHHCKNLTNSFLRLFWAWGTPPI